MMLHYQIPPWLPRISLMLLVTGSICASESPAHRPANDGFSPLTKWRGYVTRGEMPAVWKIEGDVISRVAAGANGEKSSAYLVTAEEFGNFDLAFEWKISTGGNSGIHYRCDEVHASPPHTAPEYQILDNAGHKYGKDPLRSAASCFTLYAPTKDVSKPAGEWNTGRIVAIGNHIEHWLNGEKVVEFELGSDDWDEHRATSDFGTGLDFGRLAKGRIALQDHGFPVWYRKFMIRELPDQPAGGWPDKIVILGNSITLHGPLPGIEWPHNHGMAASAPEKDYVHLLLRRFAEHNGGREPVAIVENIADFERQYDTLDIANRFQKYADFQPDIVIFAIAENVRELKTPANEAEFTEAVTEALQQLKRERDGTQRIFVRSSFWPNKSVDPLLQQACKNVGGTFVDLTEVGNDHSNWALEEHRERNFNYLKYPGVGGHPGDKGMAAIADKIWNAWKLLPR